MLSSKAKYALRAAIALARHWPSDEWAQAADVAEDQDIPRKFLDLILRDLRDHGLLESRRGAQGGYRLVSRPDEISVADVIRVIDGPLALTPCASRMRFRPCKDCIDIRKCRLQPLMLKARDAVASVLENCSLATLANGSATASLRPAKSTERARGRASLRGPRRGAL